MARATKPAGAAGLALAAAEIAVPTLGFLLALMAAAVVAMAVLSGEARADASFLDNARPSIWTDPDGCQYYAIYNGWQGFMTPMFRPDGTIACLHPQPCLVASTDQLFATGSAAIGADNRRRLQDFFSTAGAGSYVVNGHTDTVGGYDYNIRLSLRRAWAVAAVARSVGAEVTSVEGFGYTRPRASNDTAAGRALNRRVEVMCNK